MSIAVSVEHVSKVYRLGSIGSASLNEDVGRWWAKLRGRPDPTLIVGEDHTVRRTGDYFHALEDVSFEVREGQVLGVVGRNGAGKSTLLKILSQVTAPTSGQIRLRGRIASLLEVGTGFHPDLTGRENVYLNGAILGMTKVEIRKKFDEIVAFSECEEFIDTPVKRYSSGMYVRLAFAVAAHLEAEILVVDEVLAVGDAQFQRKCLGKMGNVARGGRTILFVSHSMAAVAALCHRAILLKDGQLARAGSVQEICDAYLSDDRAARTDGLSVAERRGTGAGRFTSLEIEARDADDQKLAWAMPGCDLVIKTQIHSEKGFESAAMGVVVYDQTGARLIDAHSSTHKEFLSVPPGGTAAVYLRLTNVLLKPQTYRVDLWLGRGGIEDIDWVDYAAELRIVEDASAVHSETFPGVYQCRFSHEFHVSPNVHHVELVSAPAVGQTHE